MYIENTIEILNNIDWNKIGENAQEKDMELGSEFLVKMEKFCNEKFNKCNSDLRNIIDNPTTEIECILQKALGE